MMEPEAKTPCTRCGVAPEQVEIVNSPMGPIVFDEDDKITDITGTVYVRADLLDAAVKAERERCLEIVDRIEPHFVEFEDVEDTQEGKWMGEKTKDRITSVIDEFERDCAAAGHHWSTSSIFPGSEYCQACGATRAVVTFSPTQGDS